MTNGFDAIGILAIGEGDSGTGGGEEGGGGGGVTGPPIPLFAGSVSIKANPRKRIGYTRYQSADAFEQRRLDQYIRNSSRSHGGYTGGYGGSIPTASETADYAVVGSRISVSDPPGYYSESRGVTITSTFVSSTAATILCEIALSGLYAVSAYSSFLTGGGSNVNFIATSAIRKSGEIVYIVRNEGYWCLGVTGTFTVSTPSTTSNSSAATFVRLAAGDTIEFINEAKLGSGSSNPSMAEFRDSIVYITA